MQLSITVDKELLCNNREGENMNNPIENLKDYNKMRIDLQRMNGDLNKLYEWIGNRAVDKAAPRLRVEGGLFVLGTVGMVYGLKWGVDKVKCIHRDRLKDDCIKKESIKRSKQDYPEEEFEKKSVEYKEGRKA